MSDAFFSDMNRFGARRAIARADHRRDAREFVRRQAQLAMLATWFLLLSVGVTLLVDERPIGAIETLVTLAVLMICTGSSEAKRWRLTGRYMQTKRTLDMAGI